MMMDVMMMDVMMDVMMAFPYSLYMSVLPPTIAVRKFNISRLAYIIAG